MKNLKSYFMLIAIMLFGFFVCSNDMVSADTSNFSYDGIIITSDGAYPFENALKDEVNVIKSTNEGVDETESVLTLTFTGIGEVGFDYLVSSEHGWDFLSISVNGEELVTDSGNEGIWKKFTWYSERNQTNYIVITYSKDVSDSRGEDCCYLKGLSFDNTLYAPLLDFSIDGETYNSDAVIYYTYETNTGVLSFANATDYTVSVKLNGVEVTGINFSYDLKNDENYKMNNDIEISYGLDSYKSRSFNLIYNASLSAVSNGLTFVNDSENMYVVEDYDGELAIKSTNTKDGSYSELYLDVFGSGVFSFNYLVSGRENFDYFRVYVSGSKVMEESGLMDGFRSVSFTFYEVKNYRIIFSYYSNNGSYSMGDDCFYLKDVNFDAVDYSSVSEIKLNDQTVVEGAKFVMEQNVEYSVTVGEVEDGVSVSVSLNGNIVDFNEELRAYVLSNLYEANCVEVAFSREDVITSSILFYLYQKDLVSDEHFVNDSENPFVRYIYDGEEIIKSTIEGKNDTVATMKFVAEYSGALSFSYIALTEINDLLIVKINDEVVLKDSNSKVWKNFKINLKKDDIVSFSYEKDSYNNGEVDAVYFSSLVFEEKFYAEIVNGTIDGVNFNNGIEVIYFDWENKNPIITFDDLLENQSTVVKINNNVVSPNADGKYDLTEFLGYTNEVVIIYSEEGYGDNEVAFKYYAHLIANENISYTSSLGYVLADVENDTVISINPEYTKLDEEILSLQLAGKGYFDMSFKYFTQTNLTITICIDTMDCVNVVLDNYSVNEWHTLRNSFYDDAVHLVTIKIMGEYSSDIDYLYMKDFSFVSEENLLDLISGEGNVSLPFDYEALLGKLEEIKIDNFEYKTINSANLTKVFVRGIDGYTYTLNGETIELNDVIELNINERGKSIFVISNGVLTFKVYYCNQGIEGTSISNGYGTSDSPYEISTVEQFLALSNISDYYYYVLKGNLELSGEWVGIGTYDVPFTGHFDGGNFKVTGLVIGAGQYNGLFGVISDATIKNLVIENAVINGGLSVGTLAGYVNNAEIINVNIINTNISLEYVDGEELLIVAGGVVGQAQNSTFHEVVASGTAKISTIYQSSVGGLSGVGGSFYNSSTSVNVEGTGFVGGAIGYSNYASLDSVEISGDIKLSTNYIEESSVGIIASDADLYAKNVIHKINGTYTTTNNVASARLFGLGLIKEGIEVILNNGTFSVDVIFDTNVEESLYGNYASASGYVILFIMVDGSYKYYEVFDSNNVIISKNISINLDTLKSYSSDLENLDVNESSSLYSTVEVDGVEISSYLTVTIDDVTTFEHLALIINYGIPATLGNYNTYGVYNLTINFIIGANLDFTSSSFKGLASSKAFPYKGSIDGNNKEIILAINNSNARLGAFINYASSDEKTVIKNLTLKGSITAKYYAGFVGDFVGEMSELEFNNINNYLRASAYNAASLLSSATRSRVTIVDCVNYATFDSYVFFAENGASIYFSGTNINYGVATHNENKKSINYVFFGNNVSNPIDESSKLVNYYTLNVNKAGVKLTIDGKEYVSDSEGLIRFIMDNDNFYTSIISSDILLEKEYNLSPCFFGEIVIPKKIEFDANNSVVEIEDLEEWILKGIITFDDNTTKEIVLFANLNETDLMGYELVFTDTELIHDIYKINEKVTLKRITALLKEYRNSFDDLVSSTEKLDEKAINLKALYEELSEIYISGKVSDETLVYYYQYLEKNNINKTELDSWLSLIVADISLKDVDANVVYGDEAFLTVNITYLNDVIEEKIIEFDYALKDIFEGNVAIKSKNPLVLRKGEKVLYNSYIEFVVPLIKKQLSATVTKYEFIYDGLRKELDIKIEFNNKFNDIISNLNVVYLDNEGNQVEPINAGIYKVSATFDITNSEYYNLEGIYVNDLIIKQKVVEIVWEGTIQGVYTGMERINEISAYYVEDGFSIPVNFDTDSIKNAGEHVVSVVFENKNYRASDETSSRTFVIAKSDLTVTILDYEISYKEEVPNIIISSTGILGNDVIDAIYNVVKGEVYYELGSNLECGVYDLLIYLNNESELNENYNITLNHGSLKIVGIETEIIADDEVTYNYKGTDFIGKYANVKLRDANGNDILEQELKYTYIKDGETVEKAVNVGTYMVLIEFESNNIYNGSEKTITLVIKKAAATISIDNKRSVYGDELLPLTYEVIDGVVHSTISLNLQLSKEDGIAVGKYCITATYNNSNYDITFVGGEYEIVEREIYVIIDNKEGDYLEELKPLTYSISGKVIGTDNLNIVLSKEEGTVAGTYLISGTYDNSQYKVFFEEGIYTINKIDIEGVVFEEVSTVYNGDKVNFGVSSRKLSDDSEANVTYYVGDRIIEEIVDAGMYEVTAVMSNSNYNDLILTSIVEVKKAENNIDYGIVSEEYEYNPMGIDYRLANISFEDGRKANVTYTIVKDKVVVDSIISLGEYIVIAQIDDDLNNYKSKVVSKTITIVQKRLVVDYGDTTLVYNADKQHPTIDSSESYEMTFNTEDGKAPINVGKYTMTIRPVNSNYRIINNVVNFEIARREVTFDNFEDREQSYCGCPFKNDIIANNINVLDDVEVVFEYYLDGEKVDDMVNVGVYTIKAKELIGSNASNYKLGSVSEIILTIVPKKIEVVPISKSKLFGNADPIIEYLLSEDLFEGDFVEGSLSREPGEDVGRYLINMGSLSAGNNYSFVLNEGDVYFHIMSKPVEIIYDETKEFYYDGSEKKLTVDIVGGAHVEYEGDLVNVGTYTVKVVIDDSNYCLPEDYEDIIVTINKRDVSSSVVVEETEFDYTGEEIVPVVSCGGYECSIKYLKLNEEVENIVEPGIYIINVVINVKNDSANVNIEVEVKKAKGTSKEVTLDIYHNKIIVEQQMDLEYRIDNGEYTSTNIFTELRENTSYRISVRVKENNLTYASDPVIYEVKTTKSPNIIHEDIDKLTNVINEKNLKLIKTIEKNLKEVNEKEINQEKFEFYKTVKEKFELAMESYDENLDVANKLADFVEFGVMMAMLIIPTLVVLYVVKRRFESL